MGTDYEDIVGGLCAPVTGIVLTYPIFKVVFIQQLHGEGPLKAMTTIRKQGLKSLYRGVLPPIMYKAASYSLLFGLQGIVAKKFKPHLPPYFDQISGAYIAAYVEAVVMTPFERVQDYEGKEFRNAYRSAKHLVNTYGILELYRGFTPIVERNTRSSVFFFTIKSVESNYTAQNSVPGFQSNVLKGASLGIITSTLFFPYNVVKIHMHRMEKQGKQIESIGDVFKGVYEERGRKLSKMFSGVGVNSIRAAVYWGITNAGYEYVKQKWVAF